MLKREKSDYKREWKASPVGAREQEEAGLKFIEKQTNVESEKPAAVRNSYKAERAKKIVFDFV